MITQPDNKTTKIRLSVMPRCSLYYAKITQIIGLNKINAMFFENMSKVNIRSHASHLYATDKNIR